MADRVQAFIAKANRLNSEARRHKAQAEYHRREAKRKRIALARFIERCAELGITVVIQPSSPMPNGGTSGNEDQAAGGQHSRGGDGERQAPAG